MRNKQQQQWTHKYWQTKWNSAHKKKRKEVLQSDGTNLVQCDETEPNQQKQQNKNNKKTQVKNLIGKIKKTKKKQA